MVRIFGLMIALCFVSEGWAATPYKKTLNQKKNSYMSDGVFVGGKSGQGSALLGVRRTHSKKAQIERVILDLGDKDERSSREMPFYQVSVDSGSKRIVLDLAQLKFSRVTEAQLKTLFSKSPYVQSVALSFDPEDKGATMVLDLKRPVRLEVFQLLDKKKPARVVMDLKPVTSARAPAHRKG